MKRIFILPPQTNIQVMFFVCDLSLRSRLQVRDQELEFCFNSLYHKPQSSALFDFAVQTQVQN